MYQKNLEYIGLSEKEAKVYLSLLKVGHAQASSLARKLAMKQPTIYVILGTLLRKRILKEVVVGKRVFYAAEPPEVLLNMVESEHLETIKKMKRAEHIVAELKTIGRDDGERPVVRFYEGKEALRQSVEEFVAQEEFSEGLDYGIYSYDLLPKIFDKKHLDEIDKKRVENNIRFRAVYSGSQKVIERNSKLQELIKIDQEQFPIQCDVSIFRDEVRFHTVSEDGKNPSGIVIKNKEIATTLKSLIDYIFSSKNLV